MIIKIILYQINKSIRNPLTKKSQRILFKIFHVEKIMNKSKFGKPMVLILDGNSIIGAHERINLFYFICLRRLIDKSDISYPKRRILLYAIATCYE